MKYNLEYMCRVLMYLLIMDIIIIIQKEIIIDICALYYQDIQIK